MIPLFSLGLLWWCALFAILLATSLGALCQPWMATRRQRDNNAPPVSILIPLKHETPGLFDATRSALEQAYPDFDVTFTAAENRSPAIETACRAAKNSIRWRLIQSENDASLLNPKIRNLQGAIASARHDLILCKDANTILPADLLARMVKQKHPGIGLVAAVPIMRAPKSFAGWIECAIINSWNARLLLAASCLGRGYGLGAAMLFRRSDLERAGGIKAIGNAVADDQALSAALAGIGLKTIFGGQTVDQVTSVMSLKELFQRHIRWVVCRRIEAPLAFVLEPFTGGLAASVAALFMAPSPAAALLFMIGTLSLWGLVETALAALKGWPVSLISPLAVACRELLFPAIWLGAFFAREIRWGEAVIPVPPGRRVG